MSAGPSAGVPRRARVETYPGTTDELLAAALEAASGLRAGVDFHVGYSPERIDPGNPEWTLATTPKVVAILTPACLAAVEAFYGRLVDKTVPVSTTRAAELTKLLENTFRHVEHRPANRRDERWGDRRTVRSDGSGAGAAG